MTGARFIVALAVASVATLQAGQTTSVTTLVAVYAEGRFDEAVAQAAAIADLGPLRRSFVQDLPVWIAADPAQADRRRAAAAAFLLELTHARLESDWGRLADLVEFTCAGLRHAGAASAFERAWHRASISLAGRARARLWLLGEYAQLPHQPPRRRPPSKKPDPYPRHLVHALERFPDDPELRLAQVEAWTWGRDQEPIRNLRRQAFAIVSGLEPARREALAGLQPLIDDPLVGAEALVRTAHIHFSMGRYNAALAALGQAQTREADAAIRYLSYFSAGRALEAMGQSEEAMAQYARALEVVPGAESATVALASLEFIRDDREPAVTRLDQVFAARATVADPGRLAGYGTFMRWPGFRQAMRAELPR